jgi:hypothetical protein
MGPYSATRNIMIYRQKALIVPAGTRTIGVRMIGVRYNGSNNDQYYDNL